MRATVPLRIWPYSIALFAGVLLLLLLVRILPGDRRDHTIAAQTRVFLDAPLPQGNLRILALGSSLLWAATPQPMQMQQQALPGIAWLRMTKGGGGSGYLQESIAALKRHPPDVLVIEENLLLPDTGDVLMDQLRQDLSQLGKRTVSLLSGARLSPPISAYWERNDQDGPFLCLSDRIRTTPDQLHSQVNMLQKIYMDAQFDKDLLGTLTTLAYRGVQLVLLDIPRSPEVEQRTLLQKQYWINELKKSLIPSNNIRYLSFPAPSQATLYCDLGHLNARGASLFSPWWQAQLQQLRQVR